MERLSCSSQPNVCLEYRWQWLTAYRLSQPIFFIILALAKKLVASAYSAKMAYYVSHCFLTYLPILGDGYI